MAQNFKRLQSQQNNNTTDMEKQEPAHPQRITTVGKKPIGPVASPLGRDSGKWTE